MHAQEWRRITAPWRCMGAAHRRELMRSECRGFMRVSCIGSRVCGAIGDSVWRGGGWYVDVACNGHGLCRV